MFESLRNVSTDIGSRINARYLADEAQVVTDLLDIARFPDRKSKCIEARAAEFVEIMRRDRADKSGLDAFLQAYDLSTTEGVVLMCLAEALLRIPDAATADLLIADRLGAGDWAGQLGASESLFVNASTWGLMLTGRLVRSDDVASDNPAAFVRALITRLGEPVVRSALTQAMRIMARQFVMGRDIREALKRAAEPGQSRYRFSFDMLGEAAMTAEDADRFFAGYRDAIEAVGNVPDQGQARSGISVKLSALTPRFEFEQFDRVLRDVVPRLMELAVVAKSLDVPVTVDAEEADRLEVTLAVFAAAYRDDSLGDWDGLGLAVQAYQRRALDVIRWLDELSADRKRRIPVRLVKGAYWDTEIKRAQELGLVSYPVFTRKANTDVSYLACARKLIDAGGRLSPQFATHNAHTVAYVLEAVPENFEYEFQRLHGMGEALYDRVVGDQGAAVACRVYAPVGRHEDLLPYLVRRLLENGANTSFINRIVHEEETVAEIVRDPVRRVRSLATVANPAIAPPPELYGEERRNSTGVNLADGAELKSLGRDMAKAVSALRVAAPIISGAKCDGNGRPVCNPADERARVGEVVDADAAQVDEAIDGARNAFAAWDGTGVTARAAILRAAADRLESRRAEFMALCVAEAGKCVPDAVAEIREAVDYLRYYAGEAERLMGAPVELPGPTGERNELSLGGRGVFACISPWNFPVAIFTGQVAAALVSGNTVLAKPAEQTSLVAALVVELLHETGVPGDALQFLPGDGADVGARIVTDPRLAGVAFTGSTDTAHRINRALAARDAPLAVLIAETGGQNAMLVDSTALAEQVVGDAMRSAFNSAGQRCSALRVLYLQEEIADRVLEMLAGRVAEISVGDPARLDTDVGPVIDAQALAALHAHRSEIIKTGCLVCEAPLPAGLDYGTFLAPMVVEIPDVSVLHEEHFGPILHVVRFRQADIEQVIDNINATGFGLTFGIQSRIDRRAIGLAHRISAGNVYVNRNMIGAVVGTQPFGGRGLSGTGPKAGGPLYLPRFMTERTVSTNTAAIGGNATLLTLTSE